MRLNLIPVILIFISGSVFAAPGLDVRPGSAFERDEDRASVQEMNSEFMNLQTRTLCEGPPACQALKNEDACLDLGESHSCFWSYE